MKRLGAVAASIGLVLAAGCSKSYEKRLEATLNRMKYEQKLDQYLKPAETGKFQELGIYLRPPKNLEPASQPMLAVDPGAYELIASFLDTSGGTPAKGAEAAAAPAPAGLRLHVLARVKRKKPAPKKGETPPPESPRGDFVADVRQVLASELGNPDDALNKALDNSTQGRNAFKRLIFTAGNGDFIRAYFLKQDAYEVALIWDVPQAVDKASANGVRYCLESFATGPAAIDRFQGKTDDEADLGGGEGGGAGGGGQVF
jgi:hypothetical protein